MADTFKIVGGKKLKGIIKPQGSKNEAFQVIAVALLTTEKVTMRNIPEILDISNLFEILKALGVKIEKIEKGTYVFDSSEITLEKMQRAEFTTLFSKLRGSLLVAGAMLGRFGVSIIPQPGGDKIGVRPVTTHVHGFVDLGAQLKSNVDFQELILENIESKKITLREASVTGTANIILASVLQKKSKHRVEIYNAGCEPYIQQLCKMLNNMGAKIAGAGTNSLIIESVEKLSGVEHSLQSDMIEIVSLITLGVVCGEGILIEGVTKNLIGEIASIVLKKLGVIIEEKPEGLFIPEHAEYSIQKPTTPGKSIRIIYDDKWPGLSPDHISSLIVMCVYARGIVTIRQRMFDRRLMFCDVLNQMGAEIVMSHHQEVTVVGNNRRQKLSGIQMMSPDIRAGMALLIAALSADGQSVIQNVHQINRGYENIVERLKALGADIENL
jgi:UDP-N-acetylglucosamine 1-carboxyvinyltransferase